MTLPPPADTDADEAAIEREALAWVVRLTAGAGKADPEQLAAARRWAGQSPRHAAAFADARRLYQLAGTPPPRRMSRALALPALAVLAVALYLALPPQWSADYRSGVGEIRHVHLSDGSVAILNAGSAIDVAYGKRHRAIDLRDGEALFEVEPDTRRPFVVRGLAVTATALGTTYSVNRQGERVEVLVASGRVEVRSPGAEPALLLAGDRAVAQPGGGLAVEHGVDLAAALAWREGRLVFQQTPLREVVAAINRHRPGHVFLADRALAELPISGVFQLDQLDDALTSLSRAFPIDQLQAGRLTLLYEKKSRQSKG